MTFESTIGPQQTLLSSNSRSGLSRGSKSHISEFSYGPALWMLLYFIFNLILTIHNKWVLDKLHFKCPWILTSVHVGISGIVAYAFQFLVTSSDTKPTKLTWTAEAKLLLFSILYAVNIAISNVSLSHVSLSFHQLVRSMTPVFTIFIELVCMSKRRSHRIYVSLLPVVLGICLATFDAYNDVTFTAIGIFLTVLGVLLSAVKGVLTNVIMVGPMKLNPLEFVWRMSLPSCLQCVLYSMIFGEFTSLRGFLFNKRTGDIAWLSIAKVAINGSLAALLNIASFTANKQTSALAMTVAGNVKQALSIILAIYIFDTRVTIINIIGASIALLGGAWYSYECQRESLSRLTPTKSLSKLPSSKKVYPVSNESLNS